MRKLALIAVALCSVGAGCPLRDTKPRQLWPRPIEARLTSASEWRPCRTFLREGRVVEEADCGPMPAAPAECDELIETHGEAVRLLLRPGCTDAAIAALERFALVDSHALSDVVAALHLRAQREDQPSDFLQALEAAESAVAARKDAPAALFNRALVQEELGFASHALASWDAFLAQDDSAWADEARAHRNALARQLARDAALQWKRNRAKLPLALRRADRDALARLIEPFPATAQRHFEEELLPRWAMQPDLAAARAFAAALSARLGGDHYAVDAVEAIARGNPGLIEGHLAFREARAMERTFERTNVAPLYEKAARLLEQAGSPLAWSARLSLAVAASERGDDATASHLLATVHARAQAAHYLHLAARTEATMANALAWQSLYADSLAAYEHALGEYQRLRDAESVATTRARRAGVFGVVGRHDLAWRDAFQAVRALTRLADAQDRHVVLGETGRAARNAGHPLVAFLYQDAVVQLFGREIVAHPPECTAPLLRLRHNLSIALRERSDIEVDLNRLERAKADLAEARRIAVTNTKNDRNNINRLLARIHAVEGRVLLASEPQRAMAAFTNALQLADRKFRTLRCVLFLQRADAAGRAGRAAQRARDLGAALDELRQEEAEILARRRRGAHEEVWNAYFARFREAYDLLIAQNVDGGDDRTAFAYAERARAFEPLNLILQLDNVSAEFRALANLPSLDVARLQRHLPAGTFLLEYRVLPERTFLWIVSNDRFERLTLPVRRVDVERWTRDLQRAIAQQNTFALLRNIDVPYGALAGDALRRIEQMPHGRDPRRRLVFIPDGAMHSLPFSALRNPKTKRHLLQDAIVTTDASALLYVYSLLRDREFRRDPGANVLLVGNPAFDPQSPLAHGLPFLPGAASEVLRIAESYPRATVRIGKEATVPDFLQRAASCAIVHFAGHSITDAQTPSRSALLFAATKTHPGPIDARELLEHLRLDHTRLVVLSSCSSAGGRPVGQEGVAPLVRPFRGAGVPAVIGSLWDVPDATAERLLVSFHRHFRAGHDAATALQAAQLDLLGSDNAGLQSVLAWAPFQVIGHASSPFAFPARRATNTETEKEKPP